MGSCGIAKGYYFSRMNVETYTSIITEKVFETKANCVFSIEDIRKPRLVLFFVEYGAKMDELITREMLVATWLVSSITLF